MEKRTRYSKIYQPFEELTIVDKEVVNRKVGSFGIAEKNQRIIFSGNATIVFLDDGTKGVAKCCPEDDFNETKGIKIAYLRAKIKSMQKELKGLTK